MGRPKTWTDEKIAEITAKFETYIDSTDLPSHDGFCVNESVPPRKFYEWITKHEDLADLADLAKAKSREYLSRSALVKGIDVTMSIFYLKNLGWSDKQEIKHDGLENLLTLLKEVK